MTVPPDCREKSRAPVRIYSFDKAQVLRDLTCRLTAHILRFRLTEKDSSVLWIARVWYEHRLHASHLSLYVKPAETPGPFPIT